MQYYSKLRKKFSLIDSDMLHHWLFDAGIITHGYKVLIPEVVLTKMADHILSGTYVFHIMLENLRKFPDISFHDLVSKIQGALEKRLMTGMYRICV